MVAVARAAENRSASDAATAASSARSEVSRANSTWAAARATTSSTAVVMPAIPIASGIPPAAVAATGIPRAYPKAIALEPGSFEVHKDLAPALCGGLGGALDSRVWHVEPGRIGSVGSVAPVVAIVFPHWRSGSVTTMTHCPPAEALPALVGEAFDFCRGGQGVFDILCDLVARVPAWRLEYRDGDQAVEAIRDLLGTPSSGSNRRRTQFRRWRRRSVWSSRSSRAGRPLRIRF
jgi:hypothetical protein